MAANKVRFNLKNVYYAVGSAGSYSTPVAMPGAVSLSLDIEGDATDFYADGAKYYRTFANNGYSGDLELAKIPDAFLKDVLGYEETGTSKVLQEFSSKEPKTFALLFQIDGDQDSELYVLYECTASRPQIGSQTNTATKEVQTQTLQISAAPGADGRVFSRTTENTTSSVRSSWFSSVFVATT